MPIETKKSFSAFLLTYFKELFFILYRKTIHYLEKILGYMFILIAIFDKYLQVTI